MNKEIILFFISIVLSTIKVERNCISSEIHNFFNAFYVYEESYENNFPCCKKESEIEQEKVNPSLNELQEVKTLNDFTELQVSENGKYVSSQSVKNILNFKIKPRGFYRKYPKKQANHAMKTLNIISSLIKLMYNSIVLNYAEEDLEEICFVFTERVDETSKMFTGTVLNLLDECLDEILERFNLFLSLEFDYMDEVNYPLKMINDNTKLWMVQFSKFLRDMIYNVIKDGICLQHKNLIPFFNKVIKYLGYFIDNTDGYEGISVTQISEDNEYFVSSDSE